MIFELALHQMLVFFLVMMAGVIAAKLGVVRYEGLRPIASLVTRALIPVMVFYNAYAGATRKTLVANLAMLGLAAAFYVVIALVMLLTAKLMRLPHDRDRAFQLTFVFGNVGFIGMPLVGGLFPDNGILYVSLFAIVDALAFWTYGVFLSTARDRTVRFTPRSLVTPVTVAIALALALVLADVRPPSVIDDTLAMIAGATPAIALMYLGSFLFYANWRAALAHKDLYVGVLVKMVAFPVVAGRLLLMTPLPHEMVAVFVVCMALPSAVVCPICASVNGNEGEYVSGMVVANIALCVVTLPLVVLLTLG